MTNPNSSNQSKQGMWWAAAILALVGLGLAAELTRIHVRLFVEPTSRSFCNVSATLNCDAVAQSSYSMLLGLPLSVWGMFGYTAAIVAVAWGLRGGGRAASAVLWLLGLVCTLSAVILAAVSAFILRTWCLLCMVSWGVDVALFVVARLLVKGDGLSSAFSQLLTWLRTHVKVALGWAVVGSVALGLSYHGYGAIHVGPTKSAKTAAPATSGKVHEGTDDHGQPYVGAAQPKLVVTEFSDYQCPHCALAHERLRTLVGAYPDAIRVVHRHFPLDNDCNPRIKQLFHTHACYYARLAICAAALGKFWAGNDFLFQHGRDETSVAIDTFARAIQASPDDLRDCLKNKADERLKLDVDAGVKLGIDGTPTFIIRGEKHTGALPADVLRDYPL